VKVTKKQKQRTSTPTIFELNNFKIKFLQKVEELLKYA